MDPLWIWAEPPEVQLCHISQLPTGPEGRTQNGLLAFGSSRGRGLWSRVDEVRLWLWCNGCLPVPAGQREPEKEGRQHDSKTLRRRRKPNEKTTEWEMERSNPPPPLLFSFFFLQETLDISRLLSSATSFSSQDVVFPPPFNFRRRRTAKDLRAGSFSSVYFGINTIKSVTLCLTCLCEGVQTTRLGHRSSSALYNIYSSLTVLLNYSGD